MKLAFVHIPKTGGSSIRETYKGVIVSAMKSEKNPHSHMPLSAIEAPYDLSFTSIREPTEWLHSLWHYTRKIRTASWLDEYATFESFILDGGIEKVKDTLGNNTQSEWSEGVDEYILFENLEEDLCNLLDSNGVSQRKLQQLKVTKEQKQVPELSEEAEKKLKEHLKNDYILYNSIKNRGKHV